MKTIHPGILLFFPIYQVNGVAYKALEKEADQQVKGLWSPTDYVEQKPHCPSLDCGVGKKVLLFPCPLKLCNVSYII